MSRFLRAEDGGQREKTAGECKLERRNTERGRGAGRQKHALGSCRVCPFSLFIAVVRRVAAVTANNTGKNLLFLPE